MSDAMMTIAGGKVRFADVVHPKFGGNAESVSEDGEEIKNRLKDKLNKINR